MPGEGALVRSVVVCVSVNNSWCTISNINVSRLCSTELEYLMINCRPQYLPRKFSCTVEVGSLHTLWLESLKLVFHHSIHFLLTNYSFGKSIRTSTLCMTQVILPTIVYRQIISLIIHCITIPVGQKLTYSKLTVPLKCLENSRK
jgi:hypothetical protein